MKKLLLLAAFGLLSFACSEPGQPPSSNAGAGAPAAGGGGSAGAAGATVAAGGATAAGGGGTSAGTSSAGAPAGNAGTGGLAGSAGTGGSGAGGATFASTVIADKPIEGFAIRPHQLVISDFNGDGHLDVAVAIPGDLLVICTSGNCNQESGGVTLLLGKGDGAFSAPITYFSGAHPMSVSAGDVDGDGKLDLVTSVLGNTDGTLFGVGVLRGRGDGTFEPTVLHEIERGLWGDLVDLDADGTPEFTLLTEDNNVLVLDGQPTGTFTPVATYAVPSDPFRLIARDLDKDGHIDLLLPSDDEPIVVLLRGKEGGGFEAPQKVEVGGQPWHLSIGDVDSDGTLDLVVPHPVEERVAILRGDGKGNFGAPMLLPAGASPSHAAITDLNGDGLIDLAIVNSDSGDLTLHYGKPGGSFEQKPPLPVADEPSFVVAADFDEDGQPDLAIVDRRENKLVVVTGSKLPK